MYRTIVCYGDSNTWGYVPARIDKTNVNIERFSRNKRWPGVLQDLLGNNYYVVEEGLNGRTTNVDYAIPPNRNGKTYLSPCLYTHAPIDLVVLSLGGNDLKRCFNRSPENIRDGLVELIEVIQSSKYGLQMQVAPEILIVTSPIPLSVAIQYVDEDGIVVFEGASEKAKCLINLYRAVSKEKKCHFIDISKVVSLSKVDGLHFDETAHIKVAQMVHEKVIEIFL